MTVVGAMRHKPNMIPKMTADRIMGAEKQQDPGLALERVNYLPSWMFFCSRRRNKGDFWAEKFDQRFIDISATAMMRNLHPTT